MVNLNVVQNRLARVARRRKKVEGVRAKPLPSWTLNGWEEFVTSRRRDLFDPVWNDSLVPVPFGKGKQKAGKKVRNSLHI